MMKKDKRGKRKTPSLKHKINAANLASEGLQQERLRVHDSAASLVRSTINTLMTINGGGALALLLFAGNVYGKGQIVSHISYVFNATVVFSIGILLATTTSFITQKSETYRYRSFPHPDARYSHIHEPESATSIEQKAQEENYRLKSNFWANAAICTGVLSALSFISGVLIASYGITKV